MPFSFESVGIAATRFRAMEQRNVWTTPKSYLELLSLYRNLLSKKREENDAAQARLIAGIQKLVECGETVAKLEVEVADMVVKAEEKAKVSEGIATVVNKEKAIVEVENAAAEEEAEKVAVIQVNVTQQAADAERDLAMAEPAVEKAMAALDTLDEKSLSQCKTMQKPPPGVDDVFSAVCTLLAGTPGASAGGIKVQKSGKVKDGDKDWNAAKKALLGNVKGFIEELKGYKAQIDAQKVPKINWKEVRLPRTGALYC
jgi:dynein heavy chain